MSCPHAVQRTVYSAPFQPLSTVTTHLLPPADRPYRWRRAEPPWRDRCDRRRADAQLKEFERRDLGEDIARSGSGKMLRRSRTTSITLDHNLIEKLRAKGAKRGLRYQTMLEVIVMEHLDEY